MGQIPKFDGRYGEQLNVTGSSIDRQLYVPPARTSPLEGLGKAVEGTGNALTKIYVANEERKAADFTVQQSAKIQEQLIRNMNDQKKKALETGSVEGFTENFMKDFDKISNASLEQSPNTLGGKLLAERLAQTRNSLLQDSMKFESATRISLYKHNLDTAVDNYAKAASLDPTQIPNMLKNIDKDMANAKATLGIEDAEDRLKLYKSQVVATGMSQAIVNDPYGAESLINKYAPDLSARDFISLKHTAKVEQKRLEAEAKRAQKEADMMAKVYGAITGNIPLDPTDIKSQAAFDKYYESVKKNDPNADLTDSVIQTNIMPTAMKNDIAARLHSGDATQKVMAAQQLNKLQTLAPNLVSKLSSSDKAKASLISDYVNAGVMAPKAIEWAETRVNDKNDQVIKARNKEASKEEALKFNSVQGKFTSFFGGPKSDSIPATMRADFELLAKAYYVDNGLPADQASKNALNDIKGVWSVSEMTGKKKYMKNSPEQVYGNQAGTAWIREQFKGEYMSRTQIGGRIPTEGDLDNLTINPSPTLNRNGLPVYNIFRTDKETGILDMVQDESGTPMIFYPDWESSPLYQEMIKELPGKNTEEKLADYYRQMQEQQMKQLTRGQAPTPLIVTPGGM